MLRLRYMGPVVKMGEGDLGGKARVLPFIHRLLEGSGLADQFAPHTISIPETWVLSTSAFTDFVTRNRLGDCADIADDAEVRRRFLAGDLNASTKDTLHQYLEAHTLPLAVRSSALNEDTHQSGTAGLFTTLFIPNHGPQRFRQLQEAIKLVFASAYFSGVNRFLHTHGIPREEGHMAVALETVVGSRRGNAHFPLLGGIAQSLNFFPVGEILPEDGMATVVMGLGSRAVSGKDGLRFCPAHPTIRPSLQEGRTILGTAQTVLDAVNLESHSVHLSGSEHETLLELSLGEVEQIPIDSSGLSGVDLLGEVASIYDEESGAFFESLLHEGRRVLTFNRLLRESSFPLPRVLRKLMQLLVDGFGSPVEIEFAVDLQGKGRDRIFSFSLLQARPLPTFTSDSQVEIPELPAEQLLLQTDRVLGHGTADDLHHIVYVDADVFSLETSLAIAGEVAQLNELLQRQGHEYLLLGPGRWGSCNRAVGIPVSFTQIDQARLVAEVSSGQLAVEPSQGTHFFHNVIDRKLFFLTVDPRRGHRLSLDWLQAQPNVGPTRLVKLIESERPLSIRANAQQGVAVVFFNAGERER